ncbi:hypothetical protein [Bacillus sp. UNCCL13]|uniref:hypothetical protein n=1 Tax=Bacillus sp. UNCCL13 TaxID=1502772 RepID=UPI001113BD82|nr:hypothetical protein [Bacillus sp. UNCCL13]
MLVLEEDVELGIKIVMNEFRDIVEINIFKIEDYKFIAFVILCDDKPPWRYHILQRHGKTAEEAIKNALIDLTYEAYIN